MKLLDDEEVRNLIIGVFNTIDGKLLMEQLLIREGLRSNPPQSKGSELRHQEGRRELVLELWHTANG